MFYIEDGKGWQTSTGLIDIPSTGQDMHIWVRNDYADRLLVVDSLTSGSQALQTSGGILSVAAYALYGEPGSNVTLTNPSNPSIRLGLNTDVTVGKWDGQGTGLAGFDDSVSLPGIDPIDIVMQSRDGGSQINDLTGLIALGPGQTFGFGFTSDTAGADRAGIIGLSGWSQEEGSLGAIAVAGAAF